MIVRATGVLLALALLLALIVLGGLASTAGSRCRRLCQADEHGLESGLDLEVLLCCHELPPCCRC